MDKSEVKHEPSEFSLKYKLACLVPGMCKLLGYQNVAIYRAGLILIVSGRNDLRRSHVQGRHGKGPPAHIFLFLMWRWAEPAAPLTC